MFSKLGFWLVAAALIFSIKPAVADDISDVQLRLNRVQSEIYQIQNEINEIRGSVPSAPISAPVTSIPGGTSIDVSCIPCSSQTQVACSGKCKNVCKWVGGLTGCTGK